MSKVSEAVAALDALDGGDPEVAHCRADEVILTLVPQEVLDAYNRVGARCSWWAFA